MADPHKLRKGQAVVVIDPHYGETHGKFWTLAPPKPNGHGRDRYEKIVLKQGKSGFAYIPIIQGTEVKLDRRKTAG